MKQFILPASKPSLRGTLAALLSLALVASGFVAAAPAFGVAATLTVTAAPNGGGSVTVTGAGFDSNDTGGYRLAIAPASYTNFAAAQTAGALVAGTEYLIQPGATQDLSASPKIDVLNGSGGFTITVNAPAANVTSWKVFVTSATTPVADTTVSAFITYSTAPTPTVTVTQTTGGAAPTNLEPTATTSLTISGSGFVANPTSNAANTTQANRPPLSGKFGGLYVVFGKFANVWQPSGGAASSTRTVIAQKWGVANSTDLAAIGGTNAGGFVLNNDGTFSITIDVSVTDANDLLSGNYGVYTYPGGGAKYASFETYTPVTFLPRPTITVSQTTNLQPGDTVTVTGTGFTARANTNGSRPPLSGVFGGVYVAFGRYPAVWKPSANVSSSLRKNGPTPASVKWAVLAANVNTIGGANAGGIVVDANGNFTTTITVTDNFAGMPSTGNFGIYTYGGSGASSTAFETYTPITFATPSAPSQGQNNTVTDSTNVTQSGYLSWSIDNEFRSYVTGTIANGSVSVSGGSTSSNGRYNFGQSGGDYNFTSLVGTADYSGAVRFLGHSGSLDLTFSNPSVVVHSASSGTLYLTVNGSRVAFGTVHLAAAGRSSSGGAQLYTNAPVTLSSAGASVFNGFYNAGRTLAPISFVVGKSGAAPSGATGRIAAASAPKVFTPPATPPARTGIVLSPSAVSALSSGRQATITVDGFQPNETGIAIVVYSTPTVLATDLTANANGEVTWTGSLPASLKGKHTLTVQGSIAKGIELTVLGKTNTCDVSGATLDWGFKESFLSYLDSSIANGSWVLDGVTESNQVFSWTGGTGIVDTESIAGLVAFPGSIQFVGHDGALDTTIANPQIEITEDGKAYLLLDVKGTTQGGETVSQAGVRFAELDMSGIERSADGITAANVSATLTEAGASAFGTYPAGEELDAVSFTLPVAVDCASGIVANSELDAANTDATNALNGWLIAALIALLVIIAAAVIAYLVIRRKKIDSE